MRCSLLAVILSASLAESQTAWNIGQSVKTSSGHIVGQPSAWKSQVSEYLGVPFAQAPEGNLRWAAPAPIKDDSKTINATKYGFSCAESASRLSRANPKAPKNIGAAENEMREDCLNLNIWTKPQTGEKKKAVMIWIYGGGFVVGSSANQAYDGARLADEHDVIVVSVNYRLGVLGFPGVALPEKNLGLLDQRAAVEWLRDNVEKFGGDSKRMILFGQSAGGASVDFYAYSYTKDPIVHGFIPQSGTAGLTSSAPRTTTNSTNSIAAITSWSNLSEKLGCGAVTGDDVAKTLSCMRSKPVDTVLDATVPKTSASAVGSWGPKFDAKTVFADTGARGAKGDFIKAPILVGNTNNEGASSGALPTSASSLLSNCPSHLAATLRRNANVPAWRYLYAGEFPNHTLGPCCPNATGAWHGSEIALIFGTTELKKKGDDTAEEKKLSKVLSEAWTGFAKDPVKGLEKLGWPVYDPNKPSVIVLGGKDSAEVKFIEHAKVDPATCGRSSKIN